MSGPSGPRSKLEYASDRERPTSAIPDPSPEEIP